MTNFYFGRLNYCGGFTIIGFSTFYFFYLLFTPNIDKKNEDLFIFFILGPFMILFALIFGIILYFKPSNTEMEERLISI